MILGILTESWIDTFNAKEADEFLKYVDKIVVVSENEQYDDDPYYYVKGNYKSVHSLLESLALCKAYSQKTLFSANYSLVTLTDKTPGDIREEWEHELKQRRLV